MTDEDKNEYLKLRDKIRKTERRLLPIFSVSFLALIAAAIFSEYLFKYILPIAIVVFILFVVSYSLYLISLNGKLKKSENKIIACGGKNEKD